MSENNNTGLDEPIDNFLPPSELSNIEIGHTYNKITGVINSHDRKIFDPKMLDPKEDIPFSPPIGNRSYSKASCMNNMEMAKGLGLGIKGNVSIGMSKIAASYSMSSAKYNMQSSQTERVCIYYLFQQAYSELKYGQLEKNTFYNALLPEIKKDLDAIINAKFITDKYVAYSNFIEKYGHGCVTRIYFVSGSVAEVSLEINQIAMKEKSRHEVALSVAINSSANISGAVSWSKDVTKKYATSKIKYKNHTFPSNSKTSEWVKKLSEGVLSKMVSKEWDKITIPDIKEHEPKHIKIDPYDDKTKKEIQRKSVIELKQQGEKRKGKGENLEAAYVFDRAAKLAEKEGLDKDLIAELKKLKDESLEALKKEVDTWETIIVGEIKDISIEEISKLHQALALVGNSDVIHIPKAVEIEKRFNTKIEDYFLNPVKEDIDNHLEYIYEEFSERYIKFLQFYKTFNKKEEKEADRLIGILKAYNPDEPDSVANNLDDWINPFLSPEDRILIKLKKEDGYAKLSLEKYKEELKNAIDDFYTEKVISEIIEIEQTESPKETHHNSMASKPNDKDSRFDELEQQTPIINDNIHGEYLPVDFEVATWNEIFPNVFNFEFNHSLSGVALGKINIHILTRFQFGQYLQFFKSYNDDYRIFSEQYAKICSDALEDVQKKINEKKGADLVKYYAKLIRDFRKAITDIEHKPEILMAIYDKFFANYEYFYGANLGYSIKIKFTGKKPENFPILLNEDYYLIDSSLNILEPNGITRRKTYELSQQGSLSEAHNYRQFPFIHVSENEEQGIVVDIRLISFCMGKWNPNLEFAIQDPEYDFYLGFANLLTILTEKDLSESLISKTTGGSDLYVSHYFVDDEWDEHSYPGVTKLTTELILIKEKFNDEKKKISFKGGSMMGTDIEWIRKPQSSNL